MLYRIGILSYHKDVGKLKKDLYFLLDLFPRISHTYEICIGKTAVLDAMPFKPGKSGNPSGISEEVLRIRAMARKACPKIIERLIEISNDPLVPLKEQMMAHQMLLDRGLGKPHQGLEITGAEGKDLAINLVIAQKEVK